MTMWKTLTGFAKLVCVALLIGFFVGLPAAAQEPAPDRTLVVLRGDAGVTIQDGRFHFDVGEDGEIAEVAVSRLPRGFLGVQVQDLTPELRVHFGAPEDSGVIVSKIEAGGPAEAADLHTGDLVTAVNGVSVSSALGFHRLERSFEDAEVVALTLVRGGKYQETSAVAAVRERPEVDVRSLVRSFEQGGPKVYEVDMEKLALELRNVVEKLDGEGWQAQVQEARRLHEQLQDQLQTLNVEIHHLEKEVGEDGRH